MTMLPPCATRPHTLCSYTTLVRAIAAAARGRKAAAEEPAAAPAEREIGFAGIAFGQPFLLGGAGIDQRQRDIGLSLLDVDAAGDRSQSADRKSRRLNSSH